MERIATRRGARRSATTGCPPTSPTAAGPSSRRSPPALGDAVGAPCAFAGVVADVEAARALGRRLAEERPAALVVVAPIAARADVQWALAKPVDAPVLAWGRPDHASYPAGLTPLEHVAGSGPIGAQALGNMLARDGRTFLASDRVEAGEREIVWLRAAVLAAALPRLRLGVVGGPFPGMDDCWLGPTALRGDLGPEVVEVSLDPDAPAPAPGPGEDAVEADLAARSRRLTGALVAAADGLDGLAVRCHSPEVGFHDAFGVTACHATRALAERGVPMACMADLPTLVALVVARRLSGAAHYTEVDAYDEARDAILLTNGGELDPALARAGSVRPCANRFFAGSAGRGLAWDATLRPGPATLLGFTPVPAGWRLVSWQGELTDGRAGRLRRAARLLPRRPDGHDGWAALVEAGIPHHAALAAGHVAHGCRLLAARAGVEHVAIDG